MTTLTTADADLLYPDSDGQPMADNTKQFRWIVLIKENLEILFAHDPQVFIAGDLLWYPVQGRPEIRAAPDVMAVFGRPKGDRGSYKQWEEENVFPQVVFEVLSPGNTISEMSKKLVFYNHYGVEEYYLYDPDREVLDGFIRDEQGTLATIDPMQGWVSPRLNIQFELTDAGLVIYRPDGAPFLTPVELRSLFEQEQRKTQAAQAQVKQERQNAETARAQAELAEAKTQRLAARLRDLGIDPDAI